jgi:FkbM family methyltransferase
LNQNTTVALQIPDLPQPLQMHVHARDQFVSKRILEDGLWEPYETSLLLEFLRPGDVFVDVGANIGYFSVLAASAVGDAGAVFAFEPDADNFRLLQANAALNHQQHCIHAVQGALSDAAGEGRLFLADDNLGDHQVYAGEDDRPSVPITLYHGSDYLQHRLRRLDLLKVDTQGSEFHVITGLMPLLTQLPQPPRIIIELTPHSLRQAGATGRALITLLATLQQPFWIIDHIEHNLYASTAQDLIAWCDNWDQVPDSRGFMNILIGPGI